jgi:hypothetical protein
VSYRWFVFRVFVLCACITKKVKNNNKTQTKMKKIVSLVLAFMASLCTLTAWAAEREAPTVLANSAPVSGQEYYLYK